MIFVYKGVRLQKQKEHIEDALRLLNVTPGPMQNEGFGYPIGAAKCYSLGKMKDFGKGV